MESCATANPLLRSICTPAGFMHMSKYIFSGRKFNWESFVNSRSSIHKAHFLVPNSLFPVALIIAYPRKVSVGGGSNIGIL